MAIDAYKLVELAARDIPQTKIAKALGVSDSAISQLLKNEKIISAIADRRAEIAGQELDAITSIESINTSLLGKIEDLVDTSESLGEVVRAYETMNKLHNIQKATTAGTTVDGVRSIAQELPAFIINSLNLHLNQKNEIVSIEDRAMITMPTTKVHRMIDARAKAAKELKDAQESDEVEF